MLMSMNNLAGVLRDQGKYNEAEQMRREVVEGQERVLGKEHPYTLMSMNNLALVLSGSGEVWRGGADSSDGRCWHVS
jgi:hypothetical protein